jgi:predicted transposase/invertase (TIGR01784 family)
MKINLNLLHLSDEEIKVQAKKYASQGKPLSLLLDIVFKDIFSANCDDSRNALKTLLSACIRRQASEVRILNNEILPFSLAGKAIRLDIHAGFNDGERADIEMQMHAGTDDQKARASFYGAKLLSGQGKRGEGYERLKRIYQIFFIDEVLFPGSGKIPRRYMMLEEGEHDRLNELEEIIFYELPKLEEDVRKCLAGEKKVSTLPLEKKWCIYIKYRGEESMDALIEELCREEEGIMSAERVLERVSRDEEEWARALFWEKAEMDYRSGMSNAWEKGIRIGREKGIAISREEARKEKLESARKLRGMGLNSDQIQDVLGLSPEEIGKL